MIKTGKKKNEYEPFYYTLPMPSLIDQHKFLAKKSKSVLGFKPGPFGQNAIALPIVPPQRLPWCKYP